MKEANSERIRFKFPSINIRFIRLEQSNSKSNNKFKYQRERYCLWLYVTALSIIILFTLSYLIKYYVISMDES